MPIGWRPLPLAGTAPPETITEDKWHQPLRDPVRRAGIAVALIAASGAVISPFALTQPETVTESRWHQSWSEPVRVKQGLSPRQQQALAAPVFVPTVETITADKWLYPLSEPVRFRRLSVALQQSVAFVKADPFPESVSIDRWFYRLSEPTRRKLTPDAMAVFVPAPSETVTLDKWYAPFTAPIHRKSLHASRQQTIGLGPYPITASISGWGTPFAEPVRKKRSIDIAAPFIPFVETTSPDKWFTPLSDPLRRKSRNEPPQPVFVSLISTEVVTVDKWYHDFNTPTQPKSYTASLSPYAFQSNYLVPAPYVDPPMASWTYSWSMPVRLRLGLSASNQSGSIAPIIPQPTPPTPTGVYTVSGLYVIDQFTDNTVVYDYSGGVSHRTN